MRSNAQNPREVRTGRYRGATFVASPCHRINRWLSLAPSCTYALVPDAPRFHRRRDVARAKDLCRDTDRLPTDRTWLPWGAVIERGVDDLPSRHRKIVMENRFPVSPTVSVHRQAERSFQAGGTPVVAEMKARQASKIRELSHVLVDAGFLTLDEQSKALGLSRSTTWTILRASHKGSGLSAAIIKRMLLSPQLPPLVRSKILEYAMDKLAGVYGGSRTQRRRFFARLSINHVRDAGPEEISPSWVN